MVLKPFVGKTILLVALPGYRDGIIKKMRDLGADVDCINDKPNEGVLCKTLGRIQIRPYQDIITDYYRQAVNSLPHSYYDYILVLRGEYSTVDSLKWMRNRFPRSKMILYMWDGMNKFNTRGIESKWEFFDRVFTFDRVDYLKHKKAISFLPLFYYEDYLPKKDETIKSESHKYDVAFVGTGHDDRFTIIKSVIEQCNQKGMKCFSYFYMPHELVYYYNRFFNHRFKNVTKRDVEFRKMPFNKLYEVYSESQCIVDVENVGQHGLTMRTIEIIGLKKKLITTNKDIVNYDFYNENNILVIDREVPKVDFSFFEKPYINLPDDLYRKYSLSNWLTEVFR